MTLSAHCHGRIATTFLLLLAACNCPSTTPPADAISVPPPLLGGRTLYIGEPAAEAACRLGLDECSEGDIWNLDESGPHCLKGVLQGGTLKDIYVGTTREQRIESVHLFEWDQLPTTAQRTALFAACVAAYGSPTHRGMAGEDSVVVWRMEENVSATIAFRRLPANGDRGAGYALTFTLGRAHERWFESLERLR